MGTRGGRPEPQAVTARTAGKSARRGPAGNGRPDAGRARPTAAAVAGTRPPEPAEPAGPPRWFQFLTLALALAGLGVSAYLTITHYTDPSALACPENATFNCAKVTTSPESIVFGVFPVAVLGLAFYVLMTALSTPWAWRWQWPAIRWARLAAAVTGIGFIIYLIYVELFVVDAICLWCTAVHVITFVLFCLVVTSTVIWAGNSRAAGPAAGR